MTRRLVTRSARVAGRSWAGVRRRVRRNQRRRDVVVHVEREGWLADLLEPSATVVAGARRVADTPCVEISEDDVEPFVQPLQANPFRRRWPTDAPEEFERRGRDASLDAASRLGPRESGGWSQCALHSWLGASGELHPAYRRAHSVTADDAIDAAMRRLGLPVVPSCREVTVVCVTKRPERFGEVLANFDRQSHPDKHLVVITNSDRFDHADIDRQLAERPGARVVHTDPAMSLGECLNLGIDLTTTRYLAKFDDDDQYGTHYLHDLLVAHRYAGAGVVGKHSYYGYLAGDDRTVLRFPGREYTYTPYLAGGSLVIDLERTRGVRFPDVSTGEDQGFIAACHRHGVATFGADRFNFVQVRNGENTWQPPEGYYLAKAAVVGDGLHTELIHV